jgi:hypothetical protein
LGVERFVGLMGLEGGMGRKAITAAIVTLITATGLAAQNTVSAVCKADRSGQRLITSIHYPDGYVVEGPWKVQTVHPSNARARVGWTAVLDRIVEFDPLTRKRLTTALPSPVEITFKGKSEEAILRDAAEIWCTTVMNARARPDEKPNWSAQPSRIT